MKKLLSTAILALALTSTTACFATLKNEQELIEKARAQRIEQDAKYQEQREAYDRELKKKAEENDKMMEEISEGGWMSGW